MGGRGLPGSTGAGATVGTTVLDVESIRPIVDAGASTGAVASRTSAGAPIGAIASSSWRLH
eukprot:4015742-Pyramimonas_sp.AAC.1